jgi:hypothetical protein
LIKKIKNILWDLSYWSYLDVRHYLDGMHIIKNICKSLFGMLLNIKRKMKDGIRARKYMIEMRIRPCYTLSKQEKIKLLEFLKLIKVLSNYSSNISRKFSI